ncbi:hypothetical protein A2U01_0011156, partial [Trifolium medium]|nr:hypothetical protein [Trifolium medium]
GIISKTWSSKHKETFSSPTQTLASPPPYSPTAATTYPEKNIREQPLYRRLISSITKHFIHHVASVGGDATGSVSASPSHSVGWFISKFYGGSGCSICRAGCLEGYLNPCGLFVAPGLSSGKGFITVGFVGSLVVVPSLEGLLEGRSVRAGGFKGLVFASVPPVIRISSCG